MKIVIIGGTGLIGKKLQALLVQAGHEVVAASPSRGVNAVTGEGLTTALAGADIVVDVSNSPSFEDEPVLRFFTESTRNLLAAAKPAGVQHFIALSVVGAERLPASGYLRAKVAQEALLRAGGVPYTIVRATQFFEFLGAIADSSVEGGAVRVTSALLQPIAADDVAQALADRVCLVPLNGMCEIGGPQALGLDELMRRWLAASNDSREVLRDDTAPYFGTPLQPTSLVPAGAAWTGSTTLASWLARQVA